ncbi:hypothetical protein [Pararhizobium sp. O133]|uniref:hypothetical protein n=1 Tax=Pararhizobium sp. O133 TaxID=3449278 RepID=UPI003F688EA5
MSQIENPCAFFGASKILPASIQCPKSCLQKETTMRDPVSSLFQYHGPSELGDDFLFGDEDDAADYHLLQQSSSAPHCSFRYSARLTGLRSYRRST